MKRKNKYRKIPLSDVLRLAANEFLARGGNDRRDKASIYSCVAAENAVWAMFDPHLSLMPDYGEALQRGHKTEEKVSKFLSGLGVRTAGLYEFEEFGAISIRTTPRAQGARFLWLHFAALVADDMGVTLKVPA